MVKLIGIAMLIGAMVIIAVSCLNGLPYTWDAQQLQELSLAVP